MTLLASLADELGVSERTLRRAANEGALHAERPTPRTLELSLAERLYIRRSWWLLAALRGALRTESNVRFALLFGSAARGDDTADSDVDLLVALRDDGLERVVDLGAKLTGATGRRVEVMRLRDVEAEPCFLVGAVNDGRVVVDRDRLWPKLRRRARAAAWRQRRDEAQRVDAALAGIDRLLEA